MGFLFDGEDKREPDIWAMIGMSLLIIALILLTLFVAGCANVGPARPLGRPVKLIQFEIVTQDGKVISRVRTWEYENTDRNPDPVPATR